MKKLINLLRGYVELLVVGAFPERLLNLCAQHRVQFWHLEWLDETSFIFRVALSDRKRLDELAGRAMCELTERERRGAGAVALTMTRRVGFLLGLALCLGAVGLLSRFLLVVEVTGNETVSTASILAELQRLGVRPGAYGPAIETQEVANEALLGLPGLSYMAINISGTRAQVLVREAEQAPELLNETVPADIVAEADGVIEDIHTAAGRPLFADGDIVAKGEVLITGEMELAEPEGGSIDMGYLVVRASGTVMARTWRTLEETVPLTVWEKTYTGEEQTLYSLDFLWRRMNFFQNSSISDGRYDKIIKVDQLTLFGRTLPLGLVVTTLRPYALTERELDQEEAETRLQEALLARLYRLVEANRGEVLRTDMVTRLSDGRLTVTLLAECREDIARIVEREGETGRLYGDDQDYGQAISARGGGG